MDQYADGSGNIVDPATMRAISQIESGGNPNATTGSYKGLYQLSDGEFQRYGGQGSIYDPAENSRIAGLKLAAEARQASAKLGRDLTPAEQYLVHQQGVGGAIAHLSNPDQPAWQSMLSTGEGRQKGEGWARKAIWGNVPDQYKAQFGSVDNITSGQFADMWRNRFDRALGNSDGTAAINSAAGVQKPQGTGALSFADGGEDAQPTAGALSADNTLGPGALNSDGSSRIMSGTGGGNRDKVAEALVGMGAAISGISNPQQAYALNQQLAAMKKDGEDKYKVMVGKDGRILRVDQDGNIDVVGGAPSGPDSNSPQMIPTWGKTDILGPDPMKATPAQQEAFINSMQGGQGEMVRMILENRLTPPTASAMSNKNSPYPAAFAAAAKIDPTVDPATYAGRVAGYRDWATKGAESARALNQTISHQSEVLIDAMKGLNNTGMPLANDVKNWFSEKVAGSGAVPGFRTAAHAVVDELGKVFKQNNLSDAEIRKWEENLPADMSPPQQRTQIGVFRKLMGGAMDALENKRKQAIGDWAAVKQRPLLSDEGAAGLKKLEDFAASSSAKPAANPAIDHSAIDAELKRRGL